MSGPGEFPRVYSQFHHHFSRRSKSDPEEDEIPITELPNELTSAIDIGTASDIVESLGQCDSQIFSGWRHYPSIYDEDVTIAMEKISAKAAEIFTENSSDSSVVLSGCGTSGRLAFFLARKFSQIAKGQQLSTCYDYLIAGGDIALFTSLEAPEDDFNKGQEDLIQITRGKKRVLYIGITCGLSAPYVAGQLNYCMSRPTVFTPVLLGFNPLHQARKNVIEGWNKSFFDVANALKGHVGSIILTTVIGPEPITGSSRMKGGSATKIILESILLKAHDQVTIQKSVSSVSLQKIIMQYESVHKTTYLAGTDMAKAVEIAAQSLRSNHHVYYIGWDLLGLLGLLDASECVPTFSADFNDIRGFVSDGYHALNTGQKELSIDGSNKLHISLEDFEEMFLPELSSQDTVVVILPGEDKFCHVMEVLKLISKQEAHMVGLLCERKVDRKFKDIFHCLVHVEPQKQAFPRSTLNTESLTECLQHCFNEISIKWILNAISTGAHILKGNVLRNYMINLKVSNNKMFHRAISIVSTFGQVGEEKALRSILQAIYRADMSEHIANGKVSEHVKRGSVVEQVIPVAILVASDKFNVESALEILKTKTVTHVLKDMGL